MRGSGTVSSPYHDTTWLRERGSEGVPVPYCPNKAYLMWLLSGMDEQMILERLIGLEPGSTLRTLVQLSVFSILVLLQLL